ncbi:hypothetical protein AMATHDRAFT_3855 [Amanita thiersii Skay4041]|uniref:Extracellular membrane protein CFEM domain-containing protein n=1 Tax=Amanita thiersii Skay4041 TaxID=703135 RepID=A0A2A9NSD7_9AGAR|nr:hypothetical protein AMATHDRAFT_3855 [Amanita thiersii Skay4041]
MYIRAINCALLLALLNGLLVSALAAGLADARRQRLGFPSKNFEKALLPFARRQTTGGTGFVPQQCQQICGPIVPLATGAQDCTPDTCCSQQWEEGYFSCIVCAANATNVTDFSIAQHTLDTINVDCADQGQPIPLLTFPGQSTNRNLPSVSIHHVSSTIPPSLAPSIATSAPSATSTSGALARVQSPTTIVFITSIILIGGMTFFC